MLTTTPDTKVGIMKAYAASLGSPPYSIIEVINAYANYFRHRDEWGSWSSLDRRAAPTAAILIATGAEETSSANLRHGMAHIGGATDRVDRLRVEVSQWSDRLASAYEAEFRSRGLL